jgi:superfamily II DNA or RNA helicase
MPENKKLVPVERCWVCHDEYGLGLVIKSLAGLDGASIQVKWKNKSLGKSIVPLNSISSGLIVGMEVQHSPPSSALASLGEGFIVKTRTVAGYDQALVQLHSASESRWLPYEHLSWVKGTKHRFIVGDDGGETSPERFRLKTLAHALEVWNENTGSLSRMDIDPLPHQVHLVHHILASGHLNWLIADDVGLGKTIETGMLLQALEQRGQAGRILLVTPAGLTAQWKEELHSKFGLSDFRVYGDNFQIEEDREWGMYKHVIGSIDRLKSDQHLEALLRAEPWDIVIFDEAHRLSRRQYGMRYDTSGRFDLANRLRVRTKAMILLSATPHQGKSDKFQSLLELLNPKRKPEISTLSLNPEILSEMMIRNNKADVTDAEGRFIFKGKTTRSIKIKSNAAMQGFDQSLQVYLKRGYQSAKSKGQAGRAIGFVMAVYRKLAASSAMAIHTALINRKSRLIKEYEDPVSQLDFDGDERFYGEFEESLHVDSHEFFEGEIEQLELLIQESAQVLTNDLKLHEFTRQVVPQILVNNKNEKVLIFTEYRSTQNYLKEALESSFGVGCVDLINGSMTLQERRSAISRFEGDGQFLISTEAGGEGINLQRECHIMINYDLPWNPMRLVQRIGRLYRYGQKKRVVVFNMFSPDSMDGHIMGLMYQRIDQVVNDLATVSGEYNERLAEDILGEVADLVELDDILEGAMNESIERSEDRIEEALQRVKSSAGKQRELFDFAAGFNPDEIKAELAITSDHVKSFIEGMLIQLSIEVVDKTHKGNIWKIRFPDSVCFDLGVKKTIYELVFDRLTYASKPDSEMMDLDNFIFKYLLAKAKSYDFGGLSAAVKSNGLEGEAVVCSYLRWQGIDGVRLRQELVAWQVSKGGVVSTNSKEFGDWLKEPSSYAEVSVGKENNIHLFDAVQLDADRILGEKSNTRLNPEGIYPVSAAWLDD